MTNNLQSQINARIIEFQKALPDFEIQVEPRYNITNRNTKGRFTQWHQDFTKPPVAYAIRFSRIHPEFGRCVGQTFVDINLFLDFELLWLPKLVAQQITITYENTIASKEKGNGLLKNKFILSLAAIT